MLSESHAHFTAVKSLKIVLTFDLRHTVRIVHVFKAFYSSKMLKRFRTTMMGVSDDPFLTVAVNLTVTVGE